MDGPVIRGQKSDQSPLFSTKVHPQETNVPTPNGDQKIDLSDGQKAAIESTWRHRHWEGHRAKIAHAMSEGAWPLTRARNFRICGSNCRIERSPSTGRVRLRAMYCHDRFCLPCGTARAKLIARNLANKVMNGSAANKMRLVTLTIRHTHQPLTQQIDRLLKGFRTLRRTAIWGNAQDGGAAFLEIKRTPDGLWHPHLHVVCEGNFISQPSLRETWRGITGDSWIVDVRMIRDAEAVSGYVAKYAAKPLDPSVIENHDALQEAMTALAGRRLCNCFGSWRGYELEQKPEDPKDWEFCWHLSQFLILCKRQDQTAIRWATDHAILHQALDEVSDLFLPSG